MNRRQFIGYSGLMTVSVLAAGLIGSVAGQGAISADSRRDPYIPDYRLRMRGGRCHDHRFIMNEPTASFEREIFGI